MVGTQAGVRGEQQNHANSSTFLCDLCAFAEDYIKLTHYRRFDNLNAKSGKEAQRSQRKESLLDCDAFGEITRLIDVRTPRNRNVIREELERDDVDDRSEETVRSRNPNDKLRDRFYFRIILIGHGNDPALSGTNLLDVAHDFLIDRIFWNNAYDGHFVVNEGDRAMLHFRCGISFGMDIRNLF